LSFSVSPNVYFVCGIRYSSTNHPPGLRSRANTATYRQAAIAKATLMQMGKGLAVALRHDLDELLLFDDEPSYSE